MSSDNPNGYKTILITGGGGYVGSALAPALLKEGYHVKVVDVFWYGRDVFAECNRHPQLERIELDIRNSAGLKQALAGVDVVIHLACISNDPSFELIRRWVSPSTTTRLGACCKVRLTRGCGGSFTPVRRAFTGSRKRPTCARMPSRCR